MLTNFFLLFEEININHFATNKLYNTCKDTI